MMLAIMKSTISVANNMNTKELILEETKNLSNDEKIQYYKKMFRKSIEKTKLARAQIQKENEEILRDQNESRGN